MLFITTRRTEQRDLITGAVLHMISLFVVASPEEVAKLEEDEFKTFISDAREKGFLVLPGDVKMLPETVDVSRTRKGFLIKISVTDFLASAAQSADQPAANTNKEVFKPVWGFPNYEFSNKGNLRNVTSGVLVKPRGNTFSLYKDGERHFVNRGTLEAKYED